MDDPFFQEGYEAFFEGAERADCPYGFDTDGEFGWKFGWRKAFLEQ